ncbi:MAG: class I SAM-dependent methyltransferase [Candidatus Tectomicrobia bacterium]|nr:class I SAM-dependent methyltransferase [Candidatus Tectomicrobia bacterium]
MTKPFSVYDKRHYTTVDVVMGYATWSDTYDQTVHDQMDLALLSTLETVTWQQIHTAVDLACGTGRIGMWLHRQGVAHIHGVDCSPAMLRHAAAKQVYERLDTADITQCPLPSQAYDLGITVLATCHLPNLSALYTEGARLLRPGGCFVLVDYHPFFLLQGVPTHFESPTGESIAIVNFIHFISDHVNAGRGVNWTLLEMQERVVDQAWVTQKPGMGRYVNQPASFVMVWRAAP